MESSSVPERVRAKGAGCYGCTSAQATSYPLRDPIGRLPGMGLRVRMLLALGVLAATGCGRSGPFGETAGGVIPTPELPATPVETPDPTPTPGLVLPYGDSHDGALNVPSAGVVVNACAPLLTGSNGSVTLGTVPPQIKSGTVILAWQVQYDFATVADQADIDDPGLAGQWELTRVQSVAGNTLSVYPALGGAYLSSGSLGAQACNVPEYTDVTIGVTRSITGIPWTGGAGGIVAFFASGTLTLGGGISADALGFRGGAPSAMSTTTNFVQDDSVTNTDAGGKAEGLDGRGFGRFARGNCSNGGGGGNAARAGGGGGGNGGKGGRGGLEKTGDGDTPESRGLPGARVVVGGERLLPGGGGGGGHRSTSSLPRGGNGGGVVLIFARAITGFGRISADGEDGWPTVPVADGAGGGGAGGTIDLRFDDGDAFIGDVFARGGNGADTLQGGGGQRYGPGGGGGGGIVRRTASFNSNAGVDVDNGSRGDADGDDREAESGDAGFEVGP